MERLKIHFIKCTFFLFDHLDITKIKCIDSTGIIFIYSFIVIIINLLKKITGLIDDN